MSTIITSIDSNSPAEKAGIHIGEELISINGNPIVDVLDYRFYGYDKKVSVVLRNGKKDRVLKIHKEEGQDLGLNFKTYLMDEMRECSNHCIFCFVDQMPPNMRETLYVKDDDARLSFLLGNYTTLTNISQREAQRIIDLHISPINVSVHATEPDLRCKLLGNKDATTSLNYMKSFGKAGIEMHGQIVVCPTFNDGMHLIQTMHDMVDMGFESCSVVPVGITKYREKLCKIPFVDKHKALEILNCVNEYGEILLKEKGSRVFFCSDELYLKAELPIPDDSYYEEYQQLENGVGMLRLFIDTFYSSMKYAQDNPFKRSFSIVSGTATAPLLENLYNEAKQQFPTLNGNIFAIQNNLFGETITVSGLVTGNDIIQQLKGKKIGARLLIPENMLRKYESVFLDDVSIADIEEQLHVKVVITACDGSDLLDKMLDKEGE